jgi:hypothetical protein
VRGKRERDKKRGKIHFIITGVTWLELVVVVKIRLWWDRDFGPHASHPNFWLPALRMPIVLGCQPVTSADRKKYIFFVSTD